MLHIVLIFIPQPSFFTVIAENKVKSTLSGSPCHDHELKLSTPYTGYTIQRVQHTPSTSYTEYSIHRVQHTPSTAYTEYSIHRVQHTPSTAYTEYSIHRVQHTPSTAYTESSIPWVQHTLSTASTQDCLSSLHSQDYKLTPECSFSFQRASLQDRLPPSSTQWELEGKVTSSQSHSCDLTIWMIESQPAVRLLSTSSMYSSNLAWSLPPTDSPNSLDHGLQVHLSVTWSWPPNALPDSLDHGFQVHLWVQLDPNLQVHYQSRSMTASNCIFEFNLILPSKYISEFNSITACKFARSWHLGAPPNLLDHGLQVHPWVHLIKASQCISKLTGSRPPSASLCSHNNRLLVYIWVHSIVIFRRTTNCSEALPAAIPYIQCVDG